VTQSIFRLLMIFFATVVLPLALPPQIPITNASTSWPSLLYQGGLPAVYIVLRLVRMMGSLSVLSEKNPQFQE
jgi:hypothetical protein